MHDFYPFDQPIYCIPDEQLPEVTPETLAHIRSLHLRQLLLGPYPKAPAASDWEELLACVAEQELSVLIRLALDPNEDASGVSRRIQDYPGVTGVVLCLPEPWTGEAADALMDALREEHDCAFAACFFTLPQGEEDSIPEGTCMYPLYHTAYRRHALPLQRLATKTYFEMLDAMQEADHILGMGTLPDGLATLRAKDCAHYTGLPLKALLMLHTTLTGTPVLVAGEEFGFAAQAMPESIRPKNAVPWQPDAPCIQKADPDSIYAFARDLIALRSEIPALSSGGYQLLELDRAFAFARIDEEAGNAVLVAVNLTASRVRMPGSADVILSSYNRSFFDGTLLPFEAAILEAFPEED